MASRDFRLFIAGQFMSVIGTWMQNTALPYLAYRISGKPLDLGIIGFASTLPTLLLALPAGVLVERWDKRKTVIVFQSIMSIQAFGLTFLTFTGHIQIWHIVLFSLIFGTATAVEITARQSMLIELAGRDALPSAIALQTTAFNVGRVLGPLAASWLLVATSSEGYVFLVNGISFLFVIGGLAIARTKYKLPRESNNSSLRSEFGEGITYIRKDPLVSSIILMAMIIGFFGFPLLQQIPALARDVLKSPLDTESLIAARTSNLYATQGAGALIAAVMAAFLNRSRNKGAWVTAGQVAFIIPLIALAFTRNFFVSIVYLFIIGWGLVTQLVTMNTLIQVKIPNELRGRVFSVYLWAVQGVAPFGSLLIGVIAQSRGVPAAALTGGVISFIMIGGLHLISPSVRQAQA